MQLRERGIVAAYFPDRRYGFIRRETCGDLFFHANEIDPPGSEAAIHLYAKVEFSILTDKRGRQQASRVVVRE